MVLSNKKLKQKLREAGASSLSTPPNHHFSFINGADINPKRKTISKREIRNMRKRLCPGPPPAFVFSVVGESKKQRKEPRVESLECGQVGSASGEVEISTDGEDCDCAVDGTEMERNYLCMLKVLEVHGEGDKSSDVRKANEVCERRERDLEGDFVQLADGCKKNKTELYRKTNPTQIAVGENRKLATYILNDVTTRGSELGEQKKEKAKKERKGKMEEEEVEKVQRNGTPSKNQPNNKKRISGEVGRFDRGVQEEKNCRDLNFLNLKSIEKAKRHSMGKTGKHAAKQPEETGKPSQRGEFRHSFELEQQVDKRGVYVGGIPFYSVEDDIKSYFAECGTITELKLMTFPDSGKFRGIALITFKTEAAAKRALALDGADMGGRFLRIQPCKAKLQESANKKKYIEPPSKAEGCTTAYVGNLSWNITEDGLRGFFKDCRIEAIRFALDKTTGEFGGYGHIDFADDYSLESAMQLDQELVLGRPIKISYAVPKRGNDDLKVNGKHISEGKGKTCHSCGKEGHLSSKCQEKGCRKLADQGR